MYLSSKEQRDCGCMVSIFVKLKKHRGKGGSRGVLLRKLYVCFCVFQTDRYLFFLLSTQETKCCLLELLLEMGLHQRQRKTLAFLLELLWQPHLLMPMRED